MVVKDEYNIPNDDGKLILCNLLISFLSPFAKTVVSHSPTPSTDKMVGISKG